MTRGPRADAIAEAEALVVSLLAQPEREREAWVDAVCGQALDGAGRDDGRLSFPVVRDVVAPVLARRVGDGDARAARWAAELMRRSAGAALWTGVLPGRSPRSLLRDAVLWGDHAALAPLVEETGEWFAYAMHELPAGVLYGPDAATPEECAEMLAELDLLDGWVRDLGVAGEWAERIATWRREVVRASGR